MRPDLKILAFDTSAAHCAAALRLRPLTRDGEASFPLWRKEEMARGQAERLMPLLEELLAEGNCTWGDLDAIAVGTGPGNFTGIRIAVSAARGLALALGIPAIGVDLFDVRAKGAFELLPEVDALLVCLPAPRDGLYTEVRLRDGTRFAPRFHAAGDADLTEDERAATAIGPGSARLRADHPRIDGRWDGQRRTIFRTLEIAEERLLAGEVGSRPAPLYVRPADAAPPRDPAPVILP